MEGEGYIFYIILAIVYFLYQVFSGAKKEKKNTAQKRSRQQPASQQTTISERTPTWRELIKEFGAEGNFPDIRSTSRKTTSERLNERDMRSIEIEIDKEAQRKLDEEKAALEKVKADLERAKNRSEEDVRVEHEHFAFYELHTFDFGNPVANQVVRQLRSPDGVKSAVILSEILNRKY